MDSPAFLSCHGAFRTHLNPQDDEPGTLKGEQLGEYLKECVKLAEENKFTTKNAFDIKLIKHLMAKCKEHVKGE